MKVCILSMQRVGNMGSLLQSYALKTTIERLGHQVEFIDIEKREDDYKLLDDYKQKYDKEKETTGLIGKIKKTDRYTLNRLRIKKKSIDQENVFEQFRQKELFIDRRSSKYNVYLMCFPMLHIVVVFGVFRMLLYYSSKIKFGILKTIFSYVIGLLLLIAGFIIGNQLYVYWL